MTSGMVDSTIIQKANMIKKHALVELEHTDLYALLERPNPAQSYASWITELVAFGKLTGNRYIYGIGPDTGDNVGKYKELYVMPSQIMEVISGGIIDILRGQTGPTRLNIPAISVFQQVMNSYSYAGVDEYGLAFASLLPKFLGAPIKASLYYTDGYKTRNGEMIVLPKDVSTFDAIMSATGFSPADIAREREAIWMAKSLKDLSAPLKRKFYRRIQKHEGRYYRALERGDDSAAKAAMKDLDDVYFDLQRHNDDARDKGQEATIIKLRNATIQNNTANELYGIEQTLSDLPSDIEYQARESLKYIPRGVD